MMDKTKYSVFGKGEKGIPPHFTHTLNEYGRIIMTENLLQVWDNVMLLEGQRDGLYQFLVWQNKEMQYFIMLSVDKGTVYY